MGLSFHLHLLSKEEPRGEAFLQKILKFKSFIFLSKAKLQGRFERDDEHYHRRSYFFFSSSIEKPKVPLKVFVVRGWTEQP